MKRASWLALVLSSGWLGCGDREGLEGLVAQPAGIDFGAVQVGNVAFRTLVLRNEASFTVVLDRLEPEAELSEAIEIQDGPRAVGPKARVELDLAFRPRRPGPCSGQLHISAEGAVSDLRVPVNGLGTSGTILARPAQLNFGWVPVMETRTATVVLENVGAADYQLRSIAFDPASSPDFTATLQSIRVLRPLDTLSVPVRFTPSGPGVRSASFGVGLGEGQLVGVRVGLSGEGIASSLVAEPAALRLGAGIGQLASGRVRIRNRSYTVVEDLEVDLRGDPEWTLEGAAPVRLQPGKSFELKVRFVPSNRPRSLSELDIRSSARTVSVALEGHFEGRSRARPRLVPAHLNFGAVPVGHSAERFSWLQIEGPVALSSTADVEVAAPFFLRTAVGRVSPGDRRRLVMGFEPLQPGFFSTTLRIGTATQTLSGESTETPSSQLEVWPPVVEFGAVPSGAAPVRRVVLRSLGAVPLEGLVAEVEGPYQLESVPPRIPPNREETVRVRLRDGERATAGRLAFRAMGGVDARAEIRGAPRGGVEQPQLEVILRWDELANLDLHLSKTDSEPFDAPGSACFCNPSPNWGDPMASNDDPWLEADREGGPAEERIVIPVASEAVYRLEVTHGGGETATARVELRSQGVVFAQRRRQLGPFTRWRLGFVRLASGQAVELGDRSGPLIPEARRFCD